MDRDRCIALFTTVLCNKDLIHTHRTEVEEILKEYVCDSGHKHLQKYIPTLMGKYIYWDDLVLQAFDYYRTFYNIKTLEKIQSVPMGSQMFDTRSIINIY